MDSMSVENDNNLKPDKNEDTFADINALVEPFDPEKPDSACFHFFFNMIKGECGESWGLLSRYSRQKILDNIYTQVQETDQFYMQDKITSKEELRKAFANNDQDLKKTFWLTLAEDVKLPYLVEYAEFRTRTIKENKAQVEAVIKLKDGSETKIPFGMIYEEGCWRLAFMEAAEDN